MKRFKKNVFIVAKGINGWFIYKADAYDMDTWVPNLEVGGSFSRSAEARQAMREFSKVDNDFAIALKNSNK